MVKWCLVIFDSNELTDSNPSPYDIFIIGSGPAGLTVANELRDSGLRLAVLESGQLEKTEQADRLKTVVTTGGIPIKHSSRERLLGGASATWDGLGGLLFHVEEACREHSPGPGPTVTVRETTAGDLRIAARGSVHRRDRH